jgi:TonB family protein
LGSAAQRNSIFVQACLLIIGNVVFNDLSLASFQYLHIEATDSIYWESNAYLLVARSGYQWRWLDCNNECSFKSIGMDNHGMGLPDCSLVFNIAVSLSVDCSCQTVCFQSDLSLAKSNETKPTFSFFHYIFIGQANLFNQKEKEEILFHESVHIQNLHSLDILLANMVGIICWFNPVVKIYKKTLVQLHEFEADARSVENKDVDTYCGLLAKAALQSAEFPLANHFNSSLTIKRIQMMKTMKRKIRNWKVATLMAIVPLFFFVVACQDQFKEKVEKISIQSESLSQEVKDELKSLEKYYNDLKVLEVNEENKNVLDELGYYNGKPAKDFLIVLSGTGVKDGTGYVVIGKANPLKKNESKVFDQVDEIATPIFGLDNLYKNISYTLLYPKQAREKGIEGKVYIEFVIQTNGEMSDFKVAKGIDDAVDTEALRALMQIDTKWRPAIHQGEIVKMKMTLPILFKLNGSEKKEEASIIKKPTMDELVAVGIKPN